ncbi:hypothetical protein [Nostoc sp. MS1]|uniref:hypothetical protein n=1 Tax=Nostoc sp. MS1 TaxID=2764711 RepID=UPI001CC53DF3|nr:hypothetical protein [Nostoc sp. MS1]BCL34582.1 hypothetical protein NSMS1_10290 [Nostoc sp. MS1]
MQRKQKTNPQLTEVARLELTYLLAANPKPTTATEAYVQWLGWCIQWNELTKAQALTVVSDTIDKLILLHQTMSESK